MPEIPKQFNELLRMVPGADGITAPFTSQALRVCPTLTTLRDEDDFIVTGRSTVNHTDSQDVICGINISVSRIATLNTLEDRLRLTVTGISGKAMGTGLAGVVRANKS